MVLKQYNIFIRSGVGIYTNCYTLTFTFYFSNLYTFSAKIAGSWADPLWHAAATVSHFVMPPSECCLKNTTSLRSSRPPSRFVNLPVQHYVRHTSCENDGSKAESAFQQTEFSRLHVKCTIKNGTLQNAACES